MRVFLPEKLNRNTMYGFLEKIFDSRIPLYDKYTFDFNNLRFIEPVGVTILSNITRLLIYNKASVYYDTSKFIDKPSKKNPIRYLDDSDFFKIFLGEKLFENTNLRNTTLPLQEVTTANYSAWIINVLMPWLRLNVSFHDDEGFDEIELAFVEIFNNITDHSGVDIGCVFTQHYPQKKIIRMAISDFGVGIAEQIKNYYCHLGLNDVQALTEAIKEGVSTKTNPRNRGSGLDTLIQNVVNNNEGEIYIHSNCAQLQYCFSRHNNPVIKPSPGYYPGTLFEIIFNTDKFTYGQSEEFQW